MENTLPKGWVETELGNYIYLKNGYAYKTNQFRSEGIPILKISGITKEGSVDLSNTQFVDNKDLNPSFIVKKGDIVIAMSGATTGKYGIYESDELLLQNQRVGNIKLHSDQLGNKRFVYYLIGNLKTEIEDRAYGGAQPNISPALIESIKICLPPLPEQERIVAKLDKLFHKIDGVRKRMDTLIKLKSKFFESIFYENAGLTNLSNFVAERNKRVGENWFEYNKIGVSAKDGIIDLDVGTKKTFEKYKIVEPGDIIYNTMRINIGSIAIYEGNSPAITSPDYVVFRVKNASKYLILNYLKSEGGKMNISSVTTGSVRSRLYFKNLVNIPFPEITSERHKSAESILKWFESSLARIRVIDTDLLSKLGKAILRKAFKGELVSQLPTDGDAGDLLKEIMALKKEAKTKTHK